MPRSFFMPAEDVGETQLFLMIIHLPLLTPYTSNIASAIRDFLVMSGYTNAAARFSVESREDPPPATSGFYVRQDVKSLIMAGKLDDAVELLNSFYPEVRYYPLIDLRLADSD
jgi:hypothetical protein